jgi:hypothetical protein
VADVELEGDGLEHLGFKIDDAVRVVVEELRLLAEVRDKGLDAYFIVRLALLGWWQA